MKFVSSIQVVGCECNFNFPTTICKVNVSFKKVGISVRQPKSWCFFIRLFTHDLHLESKQRHTQPLPNKITQPFMKKVDEQTLSCAIRAIST